MFKQNKKKMIMVIFCLLVLNVSLLLAVPNLIDYQGRLTDENGDPLNGTFSITFSIYDVDSGGVALWTETHNNDDSVDVNNGLFHVTLGDVTPIDEDDFNSPDRWIGITVETDSEMMPRTRINSVPYALQTANSSSIEGVALSGLVQQDGGENVYISGTMDAGYFVGDGSGLTNVPGDNLGNHIAITNLNMSNQRITNLNSPSSGSDAATKNYVDSQPGDNLGNHSATSNINMNGNRIENLGNPNSGDDAMDRDYADSRYGRLSSSQTWSGNNTFDNYDSEYKGEYISIHSDGGTAIYAQCEGSTGNVINARAYDTGPTYPAIWAEHDNQGTGIYGWTNNTNNYPAIWAKNNAGSNQLALKVQGKATSTGGWFNVRQIGDQIVQTNLIESFQRSISVTGSSRLQNGTIEILYDKLFLVFIDIESVRIIITPTQVCNGLFVNSKSNKGFVINELNDGKSNASFDYFIIASYKGENNDIKTMPLNNLPKVERVD